VVEKECWRIHFREYSFSHVLILYELFEFVQ
jgi:hypothetical protein